MDFAVAKISFHCRQYLIPFDEAVDTMDTLGIRIHRAKGRMTVIRSAMLINLHGSDFYWRRWIRVCKSIQPDCRIDNSSFFTNWDLIKFGNSLHRLFYCKKVCISEEKIVDSFARHKNKVLRINMILTIKIVFWAEEDSFIAVDELWMYNC